MSLSPQETAHDDIHPDDAKALHIADGETVRLGIQTGAVEVPANISLESIPAI